MSNEYIGIRVARGGFIIEYAENTLDKFGMPNAMSEMVTEVIANESKLIKRLREILTSYNGVTEPEVLQG